MNRILVSDVHEVTHALEHDGYKLISNQKGKLLFKRGNEELEVFLADYIDEEVKTVKPNYGNCSINVIASIRKHFNINININIEHLNLMSYYEINLKMFTIFQNVL